MLGPVAVRVEAESFDRQFVRSFLLSGFDDVFIDFWDRWPATVLIASQFERLFEQPSQAVFAL